MKTQGITTTNTPSGTNTARCPVTQTLRYVTTSGVMRS